MSLLGRRCILQDLLRVCIEDDAGSVSQKSCARPNQKVVYSRGLFPIATGGDGSHKERKCEVAHSTRGNHHNLIEAFRCEREAWKPRMIEIDGYKIV